MASHLRPLYTRAMRMRRMAVACRTRDTPCACCAPAPTDRRTDRLTERPADQTDRPAHRVTDHVRPAVPTVNAPLHLPPHPPQAMHQSDPEWAPFFMNYKFLKKKIKEIKVRRRSRQPAAVRAGTPPRSSALVSSGALVPRSMLACRSSVAPPATSRHPPPNSTRTSARAADGAGATWRVGRR